jgi:excisionase family DNA binding protein
MFVRVFVPALLFAAAVAAGVTVPAVQAFITSTSPAVYAYVDHAAHVFVGSGAFLAVVAAPLPPTVPFAVSITEAGRLMGISRALIYQLVAAGKLEVVKIGTRTVIRTDVIQRFLAVNAGEPDPNLSPLKRAARKAAAPTAAPAPVAPSAAATTPQHAESTSTPLSRGRHD